MAKVRSPRFAPMKRPIIKLNGSMLTSRRRADGLDGGVGIGGHRPLSG